MRPLCAAFALAAAMSTSIARADELYGAGGSPGARLGWLPPLSSRLALHAELSTIGSLGRDSIEEGVSYSSTLRPDRAAFLMDWFVHGGMRVTGGLTFNRMRVDLRPGYSGAVAFGEGADAALRLHTTAPYLGVGYGHPLGSSTLLFDLGGSIGKVSLSEPRSGPQLGSMAQAELDRELAQLPYGIGRYRFVPQVSFGMNLRF